MHWTIIGAAGMLGTDLTDMVKERGGDVVAIDRPEIDITDPASVAALEATDVIVNCAAYTAVDLAEEHEADAFIVNAVGPQLLARRAAELGAHVVHISTDYVFAGDAPAPYGEYAPIAPKSAYGRTKAAGEWAVRSETDAYYIVRTAWLYGEHGQCFPKTMAKLSDSHPQLSVVTDEVGQPTWTRDLADLIIRLVEAGAWLIPEGGPATTRRMMRSTTARPLGRRTGTVLPRRLLPRTARIRRSWGRPRPLPLSARRRGRRTLSSPMTPSTQSASRRLVTGKSAGPRRRSECWPTSGDTQSPARQCWSRRNR